MIGPLGVLVFLVAAMLTLAVLVAVPTFACGWREGGWCDRRRHRSPSPH